MKNVYLILITSFFAVAAPPAFAEDDLDLLIQRTELIESGALVPWICGCPLASILEQAPNLGRGVSFTGSDCQVGKGGSCKGSCKYFFDPDGDGRGRGILYPCSWIHYLDAENSQ